MNLMGVGPKQIEQLIERGYVKEISDLYNLNARQLITLDGFKIRRATKFLNAVEESKSRPLSRVLASLGIKDIGRSASNELAQLYGSMDAIVKAKSAEISAIDGFGPKMAESLTEYFSIPNNKRQVKKLKELGVNMTEVRESVSTSSELAGLNICVTGKLDNYTRKEIGERITQLGGKVQSSVNKTTNMLLAGEKAGSKINKANSLGVRVISEYEFESMVS